ncbi:MAG: bifunctional riboflavin kinase/FAD synthetase [Clostridia bacterium]|nr:bifunctional riboflavin kinase/FAD synthetase [Clostridia bacterium]
MNPKITNQKTVAAIGKFDGFHIGHQKLVACTVQKAKEANALSLIFFVGAPSAPIIEQSESEAIARSMGIDLTFRQSLDEEFRTMSAEDFVTKILIEKLNCTCVVIGYNFRFAKDRSAGADDLCRLCHKHGIECIVIDEVKSPNTNGEVLTVSSTLVRSLIGCGRLEDAAIYLGSNYSISGTVTRGRHLGTSMGIPTANIVARGNIILPPQGVYATRTFLGGKGYLSVTNIGNNPTISEGNAVTIETHIFDFEGDAYGEYIKVEFLEMLRGEKKFDSLSELTDQIKTDIEYVKNKYEF